MRKSTIIEHETFKQINSISPSVKGSAASNHLKMEMLNSIISAIGSEKWARMKQETRSALEYLCFLSTERGFVYAGSQHVSERYNINSSTVRRYLSQLEKQRVIRRMWRSSVKHNGRGQAVIFFAIHPYYEKYWKQMFFLSNETQSNAQAEVVEIPCESMDETTENVSTSSLPDLSNNNHLNTSDAKKRSPYIKFVPKSLQHFGALFENIKSIYSRCWLAVKKLGINNHVDQSDIQQIGHIVFNQLKEYKSKGQALTLDERCKLAYKISYKQLTNNFDIEEIKRQQYIEENNLPFYNWLDV